jgi:hypothetical protein
MSAAKEKKVPKPFTRSRIPSVQRQRDRKNDYTRKDNQTQDDLSEAIERGTKAWAEVGDDWPEDLRGN